MGSKTDYLEEKILDHILGGPDYTRPSTLYIALFTAVPSESGGGTEVQGNGYARVAVANTTSNWATVSGQKRNAQAITFPQATGNWGTIVAWGIFDAATGGNLLFYGAVNPPQAITAGQIPQFPAQALTFAED